MDIKTLFHGSDKIVVKPMFGAGKSDNDYGSGFYTTEDKEKAIEWALANGSSESYCNQYEIDLSSLNVMCFDDYGILSWIAEIIENRGTKTDISDAVGKLLSNKYKVDTSQADVIIGYRADDSYMDVVESFLSNHISLEEVEKCFKKGDLGEQVFIKSQKAFNLL